MSLFAQFIPDSRNGLAVTIRSAEADRFNKTLKALVNDPSTDTEKHGYSKRFLDGFRQADLFLDDFGYLRSDDEIQYDEHSNTLMAVGMVVEDGRAFPVNFDDKLARLAEHIYMNYHEAKATAVKNTRYHTGRGSEKGKDIDHVHLALTNGFMVAVFLRYCMCAFQLFLRRKLRVLIPVLIDKDEKGSVSAVANGKLLDPQKYQEYVESQLHGLLDHLVVKGP